MNICESIRLLIPRGKYEAVAAAIGLTSRGLQSALANNTVTIEQLNNLLSCLGKTYNNYILPRAYSLLPPAPWKSSKRPRLLRELIASANRIPLADQIHRLPTIEEIDVAALTTDEILALGETPIDAVAALRALNQHRHTNPEDAIRKTRLLATKVAPECGDNSAQVFAEATGVLASTYRSIGEPYLAIACLKTAILVAWRSSLEYSLADLYRRVSVVFKDRCQYDQALQCLSDAASIYQGAWDYLRLSKTNATRGIILKYAGRHREALQPLQHALDTLPSDEQTFLLATHFALAACNTSLGSFADAQKHLATAERLLPENQTSNRGALLAERANLLKAQSRYEEAAHLYARSRAQLFNPISKATATFELISCLCSLGRLDLVRAEAMQLLFDIEPLPESPALLAVTNQLRDVLASERVTASTIETLLEASTSFVR